MKIGYARVSTKTQAKDGNSLEAQENSLREAGAVKIYADVFTGTKTNRPELDKMMKELKKGDVLIVTKLDRIARSATQGVELINLLLENGISVHILNMGVMDNTPTGKLIRTIVQAFSEFERDMIVERTQEGKTIAKQNPNYRDGRPPKYGGKKLEQAVELLEMYSYRQVEELTGVSKSTLVRAKRKIKKKET